MITIKYVKLVFLVFDALAPVATVDFLPVLAAPRANTKVLVSFQFRFLEFCGCVSLPLFLT